MDKTAKTSMEEIRHRLIEHEKLLAFVTELAYWDATCSSWYDLFRLYQDKAKKLVKGK